VLLLSLLALASIASSLQLHSGVGALLRCLRLVLFVGTLWLITPWWRGDLRFARLHLLALGAVLLTVLLGIVIWPGAAFSGPDGRLVGAIWPIPAPQVGQYSAIVIGLAALLLFTRNLDRGSAILFALPSFGLLLLSHTRTALLALAAALGLAILNLAVRDPRARRVLAVGIGLAAVGALLFSQAVQAWLARGQDSEELSSLTGRQKVWDQLLAEHRTAGEQLLGVGLTDKTFGGLPIDNSWLSIYHEQGWIGIVIVLAILFTLLARALFRPPSPSTACAIFIVLYCIFSSYTEVGLGDASPYLLHLAVAASLLVGLRLDTRPRSVPGLRGEP
jgi:hypothetical protein